MHLILLVRVTTRALRHLGERVLYGMHPLGKPSSGLIVRAPAERLCAQAGVLLLVLYALYHCAGIHSSTFQYGRVSTQTFQDCFRLLDTPSVGTRFFGECFVLFESDHSNLSRVLLLESE